VAGIILGQADKRGIIGVSPNVTAYVYKVFPGGAISSLIAALDQCVANQVDVVNMSLGMEAPSELLLQAIQQARAKGVACIAAAGNSAKGIMYPAAYEEVMAVTAIGRVGTFPGDSHHTTHQPTSGDAMNEPIFSALFTCFGNKQPLVCAPGVAIVSSVSTGTDRYAPNDGTSFAAPYVTGLGALIIGERLQDFRNLPGEEKVKTLFKALTDCCEFLRLPKEYQGAGLPKATKALTKPMQAGNVLDELRKTFNEASRLLERLSVR
jgi:subtilisin family serine protease